MNHSVPVQLSLVSMMPALSVVPFKTPAGPAQPSSAGSTSGSPHVSSSAAAQAAHEAAAAELQQLLTELFLQDEPAQRLLAVTGLVPAAHRNAWHLVTHTLLARRLALGSPAHRRHAADAHTLAWGLARQWDQPVLLQRWQRLVNRLSSRQCQHLAARLRRQMAHRPSSPAPFPGDEAPLGGGARLLRAGASCH